MNVNMKILYTMNNLIKSLAVLFFASVLSVSCDNAETGADEKPLEPVFPECVVDNDVAPGSELLLTFEANMDWKVSVPTEGFKWFCILDNGQKTDNVSGTVARGTTQTVTVTISVSEDEEFDMNRTCEVTLTMGGKSSVIAKYMRPAKERTIAVYKAAMENGAFVTDASGKYVYEASEPEALLLVWSADDADFRMPVKVDANFEWTLDLPEWLDVDVPESTIGSVEIVFTGEVLETKQGRVSFAAAGESLKSFDVTVPSCADIKVYPVLLDELGEFQLGEGGDYVYSDEPSEALSLVWPGSDFRLPVIIDSRCDWTVELPEWLTFRYDGESSQKKTGAHEVIMCGNPLCYPLDETTADVVFKFKGSQVHKVSVTIPGVREKFSFGVDMALTSWEFDVAGQLFTTIGYQEQPATAWIHGTKEATVVVVEMAEGKKSVENPDWVIVDIDPFVDGEDILQRRRVSIKPKENTGNERSALVLFCAGAYASEDWFESDGTLKDEKASYTIGLLQHGADMEYVTMVSSEEEMTAAGAKFEVNADPRLKNWFNNGNPIDYAYKLTYSNQYSFEKSYMSLARKYDDIKVYNAARVEQVEDFWLSFDVSTEIADTYGVVRMYKDQTPPTSKVNGYIVFYDTDNSVLAVIECVYDPVVVVEEVNVTFAEDWQELAAMLGFTLEQLTEGDIYDAYYDGMSPVFHLTYKMAGLPARIVIPATVVKHDVNPYKYKSYFTVNDVIYDETLGPNDILGEVERDEEGAVYVYMSMPESGASEEEIAANRYRAVINFRKKDDTIVFMLVCTLDLSE